jgi:hypothetical protein
MILSNINLKLYSFASFYSSIKDFLGFYEAKFNKLSFNPCEM